METASGLTVCPRVSAGTRNGSLRNQDREVGNCQGSERGYIDEVIMPHSTRRLICRALNMLRNKTVENPWKKHDNIPL